MYTYKDIENIHFEISSNCQAKCPMCARNHHSGMENPKLKISEIDYNLFKQIIPSNLIDQVSSLSFCGNFGDPIMNNDIMLILDYIIQINNRISIDVHTNGSIRNTTWWETLAHKFSKNVTVHFGIDGLEDTHSIYRIGTSYKKIIDNATAFINAGGEARWVFLTFKHNEHQLEKAKQLSKELGFASFQEKQTSRFIANPYFEVLDKYGNVVNKLEQPEEQKLIFINKKTVENYKELFKTAKIECYVEKTKSIYIDAFGYIWPCCFVGAVPYINTFPDQLVHSFQQDSYETFTEVTNRFGGFEQFNLRNRTIQEIIDSHEWQTIWKETFKSNSLRVCTRTCGKFEKPLISQSKDQFLELHSFS